MSARALIALGLDDTERDLTPEERFQISLYDVRHWLGLVDHDQPEGLHGRNRQALVARATRPASSREPFGSDRAGRHAAMAYAAKITPMDAERAPEHFDRLGKALVATWGLPREAQVMALLRPQPLSDALWRQVYALMRTAGPLVIGDLVHLLLAMSGPRRDADGELVGCYRAWDRRARASVADAE